MASSGMDRPHAAPGFGLNEDTISWRHNIDRCRDYNLNQSDNTRVN